MIQYAVKTAESWPQHQHNIKEDQRFFWATQAKIGREDHPTDPKKPPNGPTNPQHGFQKPHTAPHSHVLQENVKTEPETHQQGRPKEFQGVFFNCNNLSIDHILDLELPPLLAPDLPSNWYLKRDSSYTHSNCQTWMPCIASCNYLPASG